MVHAPSSSLLIPTIIQAFFILAIGLSGVHLVLIWFLYVLIVTFFPITPRIKYVLYLIVVKRTPTFPSTSDSS